MEEVKQLRTHVAIILDKSGSMQRNKALTVRGFNEHVQTLVREGRSGVETFASLVLFSGQVTPDFFNVPVFALRELTEESYQPVGATALYDAVGYTIDRMAMETDINDPNNTYLLIIITDGEENASKQWTATALASRIQELVKTDRWTITYVGTNNTDLAATQAVLQMDEGNSYTDWDCDSEDSGLEMYASSNIGLKNYMDAQKKGETKVKNFFSKGC